MRIFLLSLLMLAFLPTRAQHRPARFPLWTFHERNVRIYGISVGAYSLNENANTTTNGIRVEAPGAGLLLSLMPRAPWDTAHGTTPETFPEDKFPQQANGINISALGGVCYRVNGISIGGLTQINWRVNGISVSAMINACEVMNGIQYGTFNVCETANGIQLGMGVRTERLRGIQIGFMNASKNTRGVQIGLWNENEKRKLPLINWNFRS
ncbi:hypothetical protein WJU16_03645 [Chitinophaga pollutisoli]|uniref:Uncharacterized protein n=1 Tax=Chitinophaga pollutisoli TaxID=3133966 RepID=A0ABZ2YRN1_9BACT